MDCGRVMLRGSLLLPASKEDHFLTIISTQLRMLHYQFLHVLIRVLMNAPNCFFNKHFFFHLYMKIKISRCSLHDSRQKIYASILIAQKYALTKRSVVPKLYSSEHVYQITSRFVNLTVMLTP